MAVLAAFALSVAGCAGGPPGDGGQSGTEVVQGADAGRVAAGASVVYAAAERGQAPTLEGEVLDGSRFDPATLDGMVVVVNFWASWCAPCRAEADELNSAYTATKDLGVRFVGINIRDGRDQATAFVEGRELYPSLFDSAGRIALGYTDVSPNTIPATLIVDRERRVAVVLRKAVTQRELEPLIRQIAGERPSGG
ncbi:TlpA family protein disulfide reductase [Micromonospora sp. WMMC250]|uniref:TlpA family protein disulfide reductase n=1 Tax=Micromonospora sp. WMMC250 TaxID=3014781 RepID=UPI0022B5F1E0|nr:TlpA disulfide reductase family protein [Micromonospora sp. WMMC250]MCZ7379871.1 TlpA disulfide reductase family protein [Micromonospora sp. WMMC250]